MLASHPKPRADFDVGVLFFNRARQTLDCVLSLLEEEIEPSIVILDQGSAVEQRKLLDNALGDRPNVRFVASAKNLGTAAGRNRLCRECSAEWIFFVDNDVTLNTDGGVALINSAIANAQDVDGFLPTILNIHENRFIDRLRLTRTCRDLRSDPVDPDSTTTNLLVGTAALLRRSFLLDNPFDQRLFIAFEDFELSLRAFTSGRPLRLRYIDDLVMVHKHMPVTSKPDNASTQTRYSTRHISKNFNVIKARYGDNPFGNWEPWVANQIRDMIVSRRIATPSLGKIARLTFVADARNSALDHVAQQVSSHIGEDYALTIIYAQQDHDAGNALWQVLQTRPHIIHFLRHADFRRLVCPAAVARCTALMGLSEAETVDRLCQSHITFSVHDRPFLDKDDIAADRPLFWLSDAYFVTSRTQRDIYRQIAGYPKPLALIVNGVDQDFYCPPERLKREKSAVTIGQIADHAWSSRAPLWFRFFADALTRSHPDAPYWRRFMIEKFYLGMNEPRELPVPPHQ